MLEEIFYRIFEFVILTLMFVLFGLYVVYLSEVDNKLFMFDGICVVKCSNFFSNFNSIIEKSFNKETVTGTVLNSQDNNFIKQLEQLNNLYKSGVLTKEEFEKAKKKILN